MPRIVTFGFCFIVLALLAGCIGVSKYPTVEPISYKPSSVMPQRAIEVHSLQPTFTWKEMEGVRSYDLAIWRILSDGSPGEVEYLSKEIEGTEHTISLPLLPGEYYWSVKPHHSSIWASVSFTQVNPLFVSWCKGLPFKIRIVAKAPKSD